MNEEELKRIWRQKEAIPLKSIDMEFIQQYTIGTNNILQKILRREMIAGLIASVIFVLDFIYSGNFYIVLSLMAAFWIYIVWNARRKARLDETSRTENVKNYLTGKEKKLKREIILYRIFTFLGAAFFVYLLRKGEQSFYDSQADSPAYIIFLIVAVIIVQVGCEIYIRTTYYPVLEDVRYLIEDLNGEDNKE